jgi:hypothetical protein
VWGRCLVGHERFDLGRCQDAVELGIGRVDDVTPRPGGRHDAPPLLKLLARDAELRELGIAASCEPPLWPGHRDTDCAAGAHELDHLRQAADEHIEMAPDKIVHRSIAGPVWHMLDVEAAETFQQLHCQVIDAADAR